MLPHTVRSPFSDLGSALNTCVPWKNLPALQTSFFFISKARTWAWDSHRPLLPLTSKSWIQKPFSLLHLLPSLISKALLRKQRITGNINKRGQYIELCGLFLFWEYSCLYVLTLRKTWPVPIYIKWWGEAKEGGGSQTEPVIRSFKWQTHYAPLPEGLSDGVSCQRPFWLSQAHTHSYVSQGSQQVLATDTENVRKQKGCLGNITGENSYNVFSTNKTTNNWPQNEPLWLAKRKLVKKRKRGRWRAKLRQEGSQTSFHSRATGTLEIWPHSFKYILFATNSLLGIVWA